MTWKEKVDKEGVKVGLRRNDSLCRSNWSVDMNKVAAELK